MTALPLPARRAHPSRRPRPTSLRGLPVAVIDIETTGLDPEHHDVVSLGVVHVELGISPPRPVLYQVLHPARGHRLDATRIHGLDDTHTRGCPSACRGWRTSAERWLQGRVVAAYSASFEAAFLGLDANRMLDPLVWITHLHGRRRPLADVAQLCDIDHEPHHALSDALATAHLMGRLLDDAPVGEMDLQQVLDWQREILGHAGCGGPRG